MGLFSFAGGNRRGSSLPVFSAEELGEASKDQAVVVDQVQILDEPQKLTVDGFTALLTEIIGKGENILEAMKAVVTDNEKLKADNNRLIAENRQVEAQRQEMQDLLSNNKSCRMLIKYPLMMPYDSILVSQSLSLLDKCKVTEKPENKHYCEEMVPVLKKYVVYYPEIRNLVQRILTYYVSVNQPYSIRDLERAYQGTSYYKECSSEGRIIPFLEDVKNEIEMYILEDRLTVGNLETMLERMK